MSPHQPLGWIRGAGAVAALALLLAVTLGCGQRTSPRPLSSVLPAVQDVTLHQQETQAVISWRTPQALGQYGKPGAYRLLIERSRLGCVGCEPSEAREIEVQAPSDPGGKRSMVVFPLSGEPALWRVRVVAVYGVGEGPPSASALLEAPVQLPQHALRAEWSVGPPPELRLYWPRRRESSVHVVDADGGIGARELYYRANVFRRRVNDAWPLRPLNPQPIVAGHWLVSAPVVGEQSAPPTHQYALRLVDQLGNEGPLSVPLIPPPRSSSP